MGIYEDDDELVPAKLSSVGLSPYPEVGELSGEGRSTGRAGHAIRGEVMVGAVEPLTMVVDMMFYVGEGARSRRRISCKGWRDGCRLGLS